MRLRDLALGVWVLLAATGAVAQDAGTGGSGASGSGGSGSSQQCGNADFAKKLAGRESSGNSKIVNPYGYMGSYQMGEAALIDAGYAKDTGSRATNYDNKDIQWTGRNGVYSTQDFLNNDNAQLDSFNRNLANNWRTAQRLGYTKYVGQTINGVTITESGILGGMHLKPQGVGAFFSNQGCSAASQDKNGTCVSEYMQKFSGFDVSSITGSSDKGGSCSPSSNTPESDKASKGESGVCKVHVPMVQAIDCGNFASSPQLMSFCTENKPKVMTMAECESAEKYAKGAKKGKREKECKEQTFGKGTGSWSYVLACSGTPTDQGEKGKDNKDNKKEDDKKDGDNKDGDGKQNNGGGGTARSDLDQYKGDHVGANEQCVALSKELGKDENGNKLGPASGWSKGTTITADNWQQYQGQAVATSNDNGNYSRIGGSTASQVAAGYPGAVYSHTGILTGWNSERNAPILFDQYAGANGTAAYRTANVDRYGSFSTIRQR